MNRYNQLLTVIDREKPASLVEVGTWNGDRAVAMIRRARQWQPRVSYLGVDLFEDASPATDRDELNVKPHHTRDGVRQRLEVALRDLGGVELLLLKGNSRDVLPSTAADLAFIDGGHSLLTIESDFDRLQGSRCLVLDDFYGPDRDGRCPDVSRWGCNELLLRLALEAGWKIRVLPAQDPVRGGGLVQMVEVRRG
jgi:hypothetical protein